MKKSLLSHIDVKSIEKHIGAELATGKAADVVEADALALINLLLEAAGLGMVETIVDALARPLIKLLMAKVQVALQG